MQPFAMRTSNMSAAANAINDLSSAGTQVIEALHKLYELVPANTPELLEQSFRLRYEIYSKRYPAGTNPERFPCGLETDAYDGRSAHTLLRYRETGAYVGNVRLVLPDLRDPAEPFPIEQHMEHLFDPERIAPKQLPRCQIAEISRLIIARHLPRPWDDQNRAEVTNLQPFDRSRTELAVLGLFAAILRMSIENEITLWYCAVERPLIRLLRRFGIRFSDIGAMGDYYGPRQPQFADRSEVLAAVKAQRPDLWMLVTDGGKLCSMPKRNKPQGRSRSTQLHIVR